MATFKWLAEPEPRRYLPLDRSSRGLSFDKLGAPRVARTLFTFEDVQTLQKKKHPCHFAADSCFRSAFVVTLPMGFPRDLGKGLRLPLRNCSLGLPNGHSVKVPELVGRGTTTLGRIPRYSGSRN